MSNEIKPLPRHAQVTGWTKTDLKRTKLVCKGCDERILGPQIGRYVHVVFIDGGGAQNPDGPLHEACADKLFAGLPCFGGGRLGPRVYHECEVCESPVRDVDRDDHNRKCHAA